MEAKKPKMKKCVDPLVGQFAEAGIACEVSVEPLRRGLVRAGRSINPTQDAIFQMDIQRRFKGVERSEYFRVYRGAEGNVVTVANMDKKLRQLVLVVKEPRREFFEDIPSRTIRTAMERHGDQWLDKLLGEHQLSRRDVASMSNLDKLFPQVRIRRFTSDAKRHFLCGVDERQLFIAQLPRGVSSVRDAHASLKTTSVTFAEGKTDGRTVRQGEWFFVNPTSEERLTLMEAIRKNLVVVHHKVRISRDPRGFDGGKPHVADELVRYFGKELEHGFAVREMEVFVRGKVRHSDHATVKFGDWRKVIRNAERQQQPGFSPTGVFWVD